MSKKNNRGSTNWCRSPQYWALHGTGLRHSNLECINDVSRRRIQPLSHSIIAYTTLSVKPKILKSNALAIKQGLHISRKTDFQTAEYSATSRSANGSCTSTPSTYGTGMTGSLKENNIEKEQIQGGVAATWIIVGTVMTMYTAETVLDQMFRLSS